MTVRLHRDPPEERKVEAIEKAREVLAGLNVDEHSFVLLVQNDDVLEVHSSVRKTQAGEMYMMLERVKEQIMKLWTDAPEEGEKIAAFLAAMGGQNEA